MRPMVGRATLTMVRSTTTMKNATTSSEKARQRRASPGTAVPPSLTSSLRSSDVMNASGGHWSGPGEQARSASWRTLTGLPGRHLAGPPRPPRRASRRSCLSSAVAGQVGEQADLDPAPLPQGRAALGQRDRGLEIVGGDHRVAAGLGAVAEVAERGGLGYGLADVRHTGPHAREPRSPGADTFR